MATLSLLLILSLSFSLAFLPIDARNTHIHQKGFTLDLIHRDSPLSPLYNPSNTRLQVINNAFRRSVSRASSFLKASSLSSTPSGGIQSETYSVPGEYVMKISIGTPPIETVGIADTGSDLTWFQCTPCTNCYHQITPILNLSTSSSYKPLSCRSHTCSSLGSDSHCSKKKQCLYSVGYGDNSQSNGDVSLETLTFGSVSIPNVAFGCGHENTGTFNEAVAGIVGLGGGPLSLVNQLKHTVHGKFSYCLVPIFESSNVTSHINFGSNAVVAGKGVVSTPLVTKDPNTYYYLTLESVKIGEKSFSYNAYSNFNNAGNKDDVDKGNIIIDSGTTMTLLPREFYESLESELKQAIAAEPTSEPQWMFNLCYNSSVADLNGPTITVRFTGASLDLPPTSTFLEIQDGIVCLTLVPSDGLAIFGNLSQENFLVGYDLVNKKVSFKPTDCSKY